MKYLQISKKTVYYCRTVCPTKHLTSLDLLSTFQRLSCTLATTTSSVNRHSTSIINCGFCVMSHSSQIIQLSFSLQKSDRTSGKTTINENRMIQGILISKHNWHLNHTNQLLLKIQISMVNYLSFMNRLPIFRSHIFHGV